MSLPQVVDVACNAFAIIDDVESIAVSDYGATAVIRHTFARRDLDALYLNAVVDVVVSGARQIDAITRKRAIIIHAVGCTQRA